MDDYNLMLSRVLADLDFAFAAGASPTLNKQETVTFLYEQVVRQEGRGDASLPLRSAIALRLEFWVRVSLKLLALLTASFRFGVRAIPRDAVYLRTWLVPRSFTDGRIVDDYFRKLIDDLRAAGPIVVAFQPMRFRDYFGGFGDALKPPDFVISVGFLTVGDVVRLLVEYVRSARVRVTRRYSFRGTDVTAQLKRSLDLDYFKLRSFQAYLDRYITERVRVHRPRAFVYVFENQAWEKACLGALEQTGTKAIGYQSSGFSDRFLNFFPSAADREQQRFPAVILTVGNLFGEVLRRRGNYPVPVETFAATRFEYPVQNGRYTVSAPRRDILRRVLYAFAVHAYQYPGIIRDLVEAFGDSGVEVVLKFHPVHAAKFRDVSLPRNFRIWTPEAGRLRDTYDTVLFNDNSYGFEALLQGVKAYEYRCEPIYDETRLYGFDLYECRLDRSRLGALRDSLVDGTFDKSYPVDRAESYVNHAFRPYTEAAFEQLQEILSGSPA